MNALNCQTETGLQATNKRSLTVPSLPCSSSCCQELINNGDTCLAGMSAFGTPSLFCSMKCVKEYKPDFFEERTCYFEPEKCGYKNCENVMQYGASYYKVFGTSKLCCSPDCADNELNIEWRGQDDWREDIARRDWSTDQQNIKDDARKWRC